MTADLPSCLFFFFNDTATTEIYTLSLHDALPILKSNLFYVNITTLEYFLIVLVCISYPILRSEEHTSELQSRPHLVCRLLLEKKNPVCKTRPRNDQIAQHQQHIAEDIEIRNVLHA